MTQKNIFGFLTILLTLFSLEGCTQSHHSNSLNTDELSNYVDPLIGTDWVGNVYPGATSPFGMVQLSPDNGLPGWDRISGYYYPDSTIAGFSHTHLSGTGAGDLYDISFMPITLPALDTLNYYSKAVNDSLVRIGEGRPSLGLHAKFRHSTEKASAGYYRVILEPYQIEVELTTTPHTGVQQYTYHQDADTACVILNLSKAMNWDRTIESQIARKGKTSLMGYRYSDGWAKDQKVYFYTKLSKAPDSLSIESIPTAEPRQVGQIARLYYYKVKQGDKLMIQTALSGVSTDGAELNYNAEATLKSFEDYRKANQSVWDKYLSKIEVDNNTDKEVLRTFYTALYRASICPTLYSDVDGKYLGADRKAHQTQAGTKHYSTFSLWDTYRSSHPLYNLIAPDYNRDMVASLVDFGYQNQGHLPVWNMFAGETDMMIGHHSIPVIIEAILKGIYTPQEPLRLLGLFKSTTNRTNYRGMDEYRSLGYVPADKQEESVSKTLEYAYNDACIAAYARHINASKEAVEYNSRGQYYRNLWDAQTGFFRPRLTSLQNSNPIWKDNFDPFVYSKDFTESNAYQYLLSVQQDPQGLIQLMGGKKAFAKRLDDFFTTPTPKQVNLPIFSTGMIGQYAHGNEPGHHTIFLYNLVDQPWKTAKLSRKICTKLYTDKPNGLCGNEDCGQMSAWYIFASLGFYPVDPISGQYELTSPLFKESRINLSNGKTFTIKAVGITEENIFIKSVKLNGKPYHKSYITYQDIIGGSTIELEMTSQEGLCWYN